MRIQDESEADLAPYENDLDYLQEELAWIEARCRRISAQRELEELDGAASDDYEPPTRRRRSEPESPRLLRRRRRSSGAEETALRARIDRRRQLGEAAGRSLALDRLVQSCGLDDFERWVLLLAAAPCFSRRFEDVYGQLTGETYPSQLTVDVAFTFAELSFGERIERRRAFAADGALARNDLAVLSMGPRYATPKDLLTADIEITSRTFGFLLGRDGLQSEFLEFSSVEEPLTCLDRVILPEADKRRILAVVERHDEYLRCRRDWGFDDLIPYGRGVLMLFHGKPGTGKTMTAHGVAKHLGKRILNVDLPTFVDHRDADRFLPGLFREARLQDAVLFFDECEVIFGSRLRGNQLMTQLLSEIERFEGVAILATNLPAVLDEALDRRILVRVRFPEPDPAARLDIWKAHLPAAAPLAPDLDLAALAERYDMSGGFIKNAVLTAVADAVHRGGPNGQIDMAMLERAAHSQVHRPSDTEAKVIRPSVRLADVVLPDDLHTELRELITVVRHRRTVFERWGIARHVDYGKGLAALFHGAPGTGKTLSAHAVASELNRPLLTVSTPALLSRFVGAAERNLEQVFQDARAEGAVLMFDEADSLLRARGEGNASRHDDSLVNALLRLLEAHDELVLLATNLPQVLDRALGRRVQWRLRFPTPNARVRAAIWRRHLPETAPVAADVDVAALGRAYVLSGGLIKNAVLRAAFRAAVAGGEITQDLLAAAAADAAQEDPSGVRIAGFAASGGRTRAL